MFSYFTWKFMINLVFFSCLITNDYNLSFFFYCDYPFMLHSLILFFFSFIFIGWRLITSQHFSGFCQTLTWISHVVTCIPHPDHPSHLPFHPIPLGLPSAPGRALVSCIQPGLVICFTIDNIMLFFQNIPPSPSPTESKSLFCTSVSFSLFCIYGYHYHLSKFHLYMS